MLDPAEELARLRHRNAELEILHRFTMAVSAAESTTHLATNALDSLIAEPMLELEDCGAFVLFKGDSDYNPVLLRGAEEHWELVAAVRGAPERRISRSQASILDRGFVRIPLLGPSGVVGGFVIRTLQSTETAARWTGLFAEIGRVLSAGVQGLRMEVENREIREELEAARDRALEASEAKTHFLAKMSHELRTPLNAIIGYGELLMEEAIDLGYESFLPDLAKVTSAGRHLLSLINNILDLSKIEAGHMDLEIEEFNLPELINEAITNVQPLIDRSGSELHLSIGDGISAMVSDPGKVRQNLINLLSNAAKFCEEGRIDLRVERLESVAGKRIVFSVRDTGIGMNEEQAARVFDTFAQGDSSTTRRYGGTGLGLAITRQFCAMLGGKIDVASSPGQGATFRFWLPEDFNLGMPRTSSFPPPKGPDGAAPVRVLIVDSDPMSIDLMRRILVGEGYSIQVAATLEQARARLEDSLPDVVLLDVRTEDHDDWSLLEELSNDPRYTPTPAIVVTLSPDRTRALAIGAVDHLSKPIDRDRLLHSVRQHTQKGGATSILVVEDDRTGRLIARRALEARGWEVVEAIDGRQALEKLGRIRPDLILLDLGLPQMDGFAFVQELRRRAICADVPIVVLTAAELSEDELTYLRRSVQDVVRKGSVAELSNLVSTLERFLHANPPPTR